MDLRLENKKVFVSGSSRGIGLSIARKFIEEGANVVINARNTLKLQSGDLTEVVGGDTEIKHNKGGQVVTGETEQFVEELREKAVKEATDIINAQIQVLKDTANVGIEEYNKRVKQIKELTDTVKDAKKNVKKLLHRKNINNAATINK